DHEAATTETPSAAATTPTTILAHFFSGLPFVILLHGHFFAFAHGHHSGFAVFKCKYGEAALFGLAIGWPAPKAIRLRLYDLGRPAVICFFGQLCCRFFHL